MCIGDRPPALARPAWLAMLMTSLAACGQFEMRDQPRFEPLEASGFFEDGRSARTPPEGTVPFGAFRGDLVLYTGRNPDGQPASELPVSLDRALLDRGRERYDIFCAPCHDRAGTGNGMVIRRGFRPAPPSFHSDRMRAAPLGHYFDVITSGWGAMPDYAVEVPLEDRWAIAAYIRVLQWSQAAPLDAVAPEMREQLESRRP